MKEWIYVMAEFVSFSFKDKNGYVKIFFVVINIMPQMLLIELNLYWTQNISLNLVNTQECTYIF